MTTISRHTALHEAHEALGAHFTDFGGWDMPLRYGSELAEHKAVRESAGLFDLSHMGEVRVTGPDSVAFLNTALAGNLGVVKVGKAKYSMILNEQAGIIDDLITYRLGETEFLVVPNAGNAPVVFAALQERAAGFDVTLVNESDATSLVAGPGLGGHPPWPGPGRAARDHHGNAVLRRCPGHHRRYRRAPGPHGLHGRGRL